MRAYFSDFIRRFAADYFGFCTPEQEKQLREFVGGIPLVFSERGLRNYATQATAALQAELAKVREGLDAEKLMTDVLRRQYQSSQHELAQLREQAERYAKDAERYRYLRDLEQQHFFGDCDGELFWHRTRLSPDVIDLAIDAAIAKQKEQK